MTRLLIIILIIACIFLLTQNHPEGFHDNQISSPYRYPLSYNLNPYSQTDQSYPEQVPFNGQVSNTYDIGSMATAPLLYPSQMYPKVPWYPNIGKPCVPGTCGATSSCVNGYCKPNITGKTTFGVNVN